MIKMNGIDFVEPPGSSMPLWDWLDSWGGPHSAEVFSFFLSFSSCQNISPSLSVCLLCFICHGVFFSLTVSFFGASVCLVFDLFFVATWLSFRLLMMTNNQLFSADANLPTFLFVLSFFYFITRSFNLRFGASLIWSSVVFFRVKKWGEKLWRAVGDADVACIAAGP